jgi:hypothetical protein
MSKTRANRDSWQTRDMPDEKQKLAFTRVFSSSEYKLLQMGFIPDEMEEKWFIYMEKDWLYFHRSWTGICIYRMHLERAKGGYEVIETWVNRDPEQYSDTDDQRDIARLNLLIDQFLIGKKAAPIHEE